jgi:hypothetical protein
MAPVADRVTFDAIVEPNFRLFELRVTLRRYHEVR